MKNSFSTFGVVIGISALALVLIVITLIFLSESFSSAEQPLASASHGNSEPSDMQIYVNALERIRNEYSNVKTVEMEADVSITIVKPGGNVSGTGEIKYNAKENKYRYACALSDNLVEEGLMRNVDVLFNGEKYYFYDHESKIVSYQKSEEIKLPTALPNPFFLPIDFLGNDDDSCEGCKMRLQDIKMPVKWAKRINSISEISKETENEIIHSLIQMPGGDFNKAPYNYRVRLVGPVDRLQQVSIHKVKPNGIALAEIILNDLRDVAGINTKVPFKLDVIARDDNGAPMLTAVFTIRSLKINQSFVDSLLVPNFAGAEQFWNSDEKAFDGQ